MNPARIALFTDGIYPYVMGGMQRHSFFLAKYLAAAGVHVDLYHMQGKNGLDAAALDCFTPEEKKNIYPVLAGFPAFFPLPGHYLKESYAYSVNIFRAFRDRPPVDFVYAKGFSAWRLLEEKKKGFSCPGVGVNFHGIEMFQPPLNMRSRMESWLLKGPAKYNMDNADVIFSYGSRITDLLTVLGYDRKKIEEIPAAIESALISERVAPANQPLRFIFAGRDERRKGLDGVYKAISMLEKQGKDFQLHIAGPVSASRRINNRKVIYHGPVHHNAEMLRHMRACDILLCPSYAEGMPNVILEAMSQGLAVIATDTGAVNLMVSSANGWLLKKPDSAGVFEAMSAAFELGAEELLARKTASLEKIREFTWEKVIVKLMAVLTKYRIPA